MNRKTTLTILLLLFITFIQAQQPIWQKLAGFNNANSAIWMSSGNGKTYAITADRWIYYNDSNSDSWQPFVNVPAFFNVGSIKASPTSNRVFCLTSSSGIAFTDNFGSSWQNNNLNTGGGNSGMGAYVLAYGILNTKLVVATLGAVTGEIQNKIFISSNNGNSFSQIGTIGFYPTNFHFITENTIVAPSSNGIFKTTNINSGNWSSIGFSGLEVTDLEVNGDEMYASVKETNGFAHVYKTEDGGENWTILEGLPVEVEIPKMTMDWVNNRLFAATTSGIYAYVNNTWTLVSTIDKSHEIITTPNNSVMFCGVRVYGINKIANNSLSVEQLNTGLQLPADFMVVTDDNQIYSASSRTAFLSKFNLDNADWEVYELFENLPTTNILALEKAPNGQCVIGGMHYIAQTENQGENINILASTDSGPLAPIYNILFPQKMFVGNNGSISLVQHSSQNYIDYSADMGNNWSVLFQTVSGVSPGFLFVDKVCSGTQTHYILGSSNQSGQSIVISSNNNGANWSVLPNLVHPINSIFMDKEDTLYATTFSSVYHWNVNSQSWVDLNINLGQNSTSKVTELAFDSENRLYVLNRTTLSSFTEEGIYLPTESGFSHIPFPVIGGQTLRMKRLSFAGDNIPIMMTDIQSADSDLTGYYYYSTESLLSTKQEPIKPQFKLYPNPASDKIYITGLDNHTIKANLVSLLGKRVEVEIQNGTLDVQDMSSGLYILNFEFETNNYQFKISVK